MNNEAARTKTILITLIPFLIALLIMSPRLLSPQFGLLDDGANLADVRTILQGDLSMSHDLQAGRFRPVYWLYFTIIYILAGARPFWFFFGHLTIFLILIFEIRLLMKQMQAHSWQILISSLVFIFSIPIIENFYTLSKSEPAQLVFLLSAVICFGALKKSSRACSRWLYSILSFISLFLAMMAKETTIIMAPIAILWVSSFFIYPDKYLKTEIHAHLLFSFAIFISITIFFILRSVWGSPPLIGGTYTGRYSFTLMSLLANTARWMTLFTFYFHYLIPFFIAAMMVIISKGLSSLQHKSQIIYWMIWTIVWALILVPWEFAEAYYLLPFGLGASVLIGLFSPQFLQEFKNNKGLLNKAIITLLAITAILFLATIPSYVTHALVQLSFDRINEQMLTIVKNTVPKNGKLITGMDAPNEYVRNINFFLMGHYERPDISTQFTSLQNLGTLPEYSEGVIIIPHITNQPRLLLRAGVEEEFTMRWRETVYEEMEEDIILLQSLRSDFRMFNLNLPVIGCPILGPRGFCQQPDPIIDNRLFSYGWDVYRIK